MAADMTVTVEAGCPLAVLDATLAAAGQWLPIDPPRRERTTIGGLVAANLSGPLRASQGTVRDLLLGVRVVGADGALVSAGGRVVKNVAGYDLSKLHVGALGTLGVIVEATFKVRPRPMCEAAVVIACPRIAEAAAVALAVRDVGGGPLWLEIAGPGVLGEAPAVAVGLGGAAEDVAAARAAVGEAARRRRLEAVAVDGASELRARLGSLAAEDGAVVLRMAALPSDVAAVLATLPRARSAAHAASGVVHAVLAHPDDAPAVVARLRATLAASGGTVVVARAPAGVKRGLDVWGDPGPGRELMRRVKAALDPEAMLAPGRFVAGL
jgi:glycolate oxidase FAD binding subunit